MTPESLISAFALFDRWALALAQLRGERLPTPPVTPGRVIKAPEIPDPATDAAQQDAELAASRLWQALADTEGGDVD